MKQRGYLSYLLRLWETSDGERKVWHASLESPGTGDRRSFADVQTLFDFLQQEMAHQDNHQHSKKGDQYA